jgi:hypothetical protein
MRSPSPRRAVVAAALMAAMLLAGDSLTQSASAHTIAWRADTGASNVRRAAVKRTSRSRYRIRASRSRRVRSAPLPVGADVWARLRHCESGGRYNINTGNGYYGAYQFLPRTWRGLGYPGMPHQAPPEVQDEAARKLQARSGWGQWPACTRKLRLR